MNHLVQQELPAADALFHQQKENAIYQRYKAPFGLTYFEFMWAYLFP